MHNRNIRYSLTLALFFVLTIVPSLGSFAQEKRPLSLDDVMKFRAIESPLLSEDGNWVVYVAQPDRGDGKLMIHSLRSTTVYSADRSSAPVIAKNSSWVAAALKPKAVDVEGQKEEKDKPKPGMVVLNLATGDTITVERIDRFAFSEDGAWLAYLHFRSDETMKDSNSSNKEAGKPKDSEKKTIGGSLVVRSLPTGKEERMPFVLSFAFDTTAQYLAYTVADTPGKHNGVFLIDLKDTSLTQRTILAGNNGLYTHLTWSSKPGKLAFVGATMDKKERPGPASLWVWESTSGRAVEVVPSAKASAGWIIPSKNDLAWSKDGERLFFGLKPSDADTTSSAEDTSKQKAVEADMFDIASLLKKRDLNVWHTNDPRIIPHQKKRWKEVKDHTFRAVYHLSSKRVVQLADETMPYLNHSDNPDVVLGRSDVPYLKFTTWDGNFSDFYAVNPRDGTRKLIVSRLDGNVSLSPGGKYAAFYKDKHWFLHDVKTGTTRNLTIQLGVPFYDEEHDRPDPPVGFGLAGWTENDRSILLYDKYDIWEFPTGGGTPLNLTGGVGRKQNYTFRIQKTDPEARAFAAGQKLLLTAYHNARKHAAFYTCTVGRAGVNRLIEEEKRFSFVTKAKRAGRLLYTRQSYSEFPDLWVSDIEFRSPRKISDANPQITDFAWGTSELVEWLSVDGRPLQGVLIKPGNYEAGKRYPVLVYFYELSSQRLHEFNQIVINHRPCFPYYASNGYALFLPDVRFEVGRPGFSATKCIVPGVQKLIDMGVADPKAVALHGHSWSGYQTAFVITQTNMFTCAIAGAPVANMTSAYGGIRLESGLARQFQYEQDQSRIGGSLWEYPERYIENSPLFFADRIQTPLLIQAGDEDEAVPWHQSVELYLAMRRLGKECVFLQYRGEVHHLKKYPNKLDYTIKMKEYLDHYLKGTPAPEWMTKGVPYSE